MGLIAAGVRVGGAQVAGASSGWGGGGAETDWQTLQDERAWCIYNQDTSSWDSCT